MRHYYYTKAKNGLDLTCNICGRVEFLQRIKNHEYIGGKLVGEVYSDATPGWYFGKDRDICPECKQKVDNFLGLNN